MSLSRFILGLCLAVSLAFPAFAQQSSKVGAERHVMVRLVPERTNINPGETFLVAAEQVIDDGWHTYWINAGDSGEAMRLKWTLPEGFSVGKTLWPVPHRQDIGPLTSHAYAGSVAVLYEITAPESLPPGPLTIKADAELLVCADICIPEFSAHEMTLNDGTDADNSGFIENAKAALPAVTDAAVSYSLEDGNFALHFDPALLPAAADSAVFDVFPYEWGIIDNTAPVDARRSEGKITVLKKHGGRDLAEVGAVRTLLVYGEGKAYEVTARPAGVAAALGGDSAAPAGTSTAATGLAQAVLFALLGGLILNLMPCVFPVLSMKALSLCKLSDREQGAARLQGLFYTLGILVCFAAIAGLLMALRAAGAQIGWGFQLQNPMVVLYLSYLLFLIGLNLSGFFEISGRLMNAGASLAGKGGAAGAFFTGVLAALVATPCTAPFMGAAMGYALTKPAFTGFAVFGALGFGLALPYLLLCFVPALRHKLPKPGVWMAGFKEFLAFPMYASAAWLVWVYSQQVGSLNVLYGLSGMICLAFAIWLWRHTPKNSAGRIVLRVLAAAMVLTALAAPLSTGKSAAPQTQEKAGVEEDFSAARFVALEAGDAPLFVYMTAAWCITCKINEGTALRTQAVKDAFTAKGVTVVRGDWTRLNPEITKFLERYGRNGVPLYVFYPARGDDGKRPEPKVLPQLLTAGIVTAALE